MLKNHLTLSLRRLRKNGLTTGLNLAGLAVGVAVCLFIGTWIKRELSYDNFHPDVDRIFRVVNTFKSESESFSQAPSGPALGAHLPEILPGIEAGCRYFEDSDLFTAGEKKFFEDNIQIADSNFFHFSNFPLLQGDPHTALSEVNNIVLSESMAGKYFGDMNPVGRSMQYGENHVLTVSAVAADPPVNSQIQFSAVIPMSLMRAYAEKNWNGFKINEQWVGGWMYTFLRLRDAETRQETETYVNEVVAEKSRKQWEDNKMSYTYTLQPMGSIHLHSNLRYDVPSNGSIAKVWMFGTVGLIVLLLACINYMNLSTAGAIKRSRETSIRKVMGARRGELVRQFLVDSIVLSTLATGLGLLLFRLFLPAFSQLTEQSFSLSLNWQNVLLLLSFALGLGILSGLYPSLVLSAFQPTTALKGMVRNSFRTAGLRKGLVVFQFVSTIVLIAGILIIQQQMSFIQQKELGYQADAVIEVDFHGSDQVEKQWQVLRSELLKDMAIKKVATHNGNVVGGLGNGWTTTEDLNGREISTSAYNLSVSPEYFETYSMQLAAGRFFSKEIPSDTAQAVLVNEAAVRTFGWQHPENAIGKRFGKGDHAKRVVGVVRDFHFESLHKPVDALILHFASSGNSLSVLVDRSQTKAAIHHLERTWKALVPDIPLEYAFVDNQIAQQYGNEQVTENLFFSFSLLSLFIACLGLFGLVTFMAEQKVKEIGIRKVLGASVAGIVGLLSKDFLLLVLLALLIATPLSWYFMDQWLQDFTYRIDIPWWVFALAGIMAIGIVFLTVSFQSVKAALANPVKSLRSE